MALRETVMKNTFFYSLPKFASFGLNLAALPVLANALSPEDFGLVTLTSAIPSITVSVITAGLVFSVPRYFFEYRTDEAARKAMYFSAQIYLGALFVLSGSAVFLLRDYISYISIGEFSRGKAVFVAYLSAYLGQMNMLYLRVFQSMEKALLHSAFVILQSTAGLLTGVFMVVYLKYDFMGLLYGSLAGAAISFVPMFFVFNRRARASFSASILSECVKYGVQVVPKSFTGFINRFFDKYMLNAMLSTEAVGVYNIGQTAANSVDAMAGNIWMSFQPTVFAEIFDKGSRGAARIGRIFTKFAYITVFPLVLIALFAEQIIGLLFPPAFHGAAAVVTVLAAGLSTQVFGIIAGVQFAYSKKPFWIFPSTVLGMVINVCANILLIPGLGLIGASVAAAAGTLFVNMLMAVIGQRLFRIDYEYKPLFMIYLIAAVSIYSSLAAVGGGYGTAISVSIAGLYVLAGVMAGVITKDIPGLLKKAFVSRFTCALGGRNACE